MADLPGGHDDGQSDGLETWLKEPVQPLLPPPGTFERVRARARRRKLRRAAFSAVSAAVLVAAAVAVPRLVIPHLGPGSVIAGKLPDHRSLNQAPHASHNSGSQTAESPTPYTTRPSAASRPAVPPNFRVSSVTFDSPGTGWVIGQAGTPGHCTGPKPGICISIARTDDGGRSWYGQPAPVPDQPNGVSQIRFLDGVNGWAYGPQLFATHDGGQHWTPISTHGMRVTALETAATRAFAVWAQCRGTLPGPGSDCTKFSLYSAPAGSDSWKPVPGAAGMSLGGAPSSASLVLTYSSVYLLTPDGELLTGPSTGVGVHVASNGGAPAVPPCKPGSTGAGGPPHALLASTGPGLALLCPGAAVRGIQRKVLYYSPDGGLSWTPVAAPPMTGTAMSLAGTPQGRVVLATSQGIDVTSGPVTSRAGISWQQATVASAPGGFSYVGMTTGRQGVAVPTQSNVDAVWFTYNGGRLWRKQPVR